MAKRTRRTAGADSSSGRGATRKPERKRARSDVETIAAVVGNGPFEIEDIVRVQALAELGARVLEILCRGSVPLAQFQVCRGSTGEHALIEMMFKVRDLGLLEEVKP